MQHRRGTEGLWCLQEACRTRALEVLRHTRIAIEKGTQCKRGVGFSDRGCNLWQLGATWGLQEFDSGLGTGHVMLCFGHRDTDPDKATLSSLVAELIRDEARSLHSITGLVLAPGSLHHIILHHFILSYMLVYHLILSYSFSYYLMLSDIILNYLILSYTISYYLILSYIILYSVTLYHIRTVLYCVALWSCHCCTQGAEPGCP